MIFGGIEEVTKELDDMWIFDLNHRRWHMMFEEERLSPAKQRMNFNNNMLYNSGMNYSSALNSPIKNRSPSFKKKPSFIHTRQNSPVRMGENDNNFTSKIVSPASRGRYNTSQQNKRQLAS